MELEIKVMWCKGLAAFNFFQKMAVYAAVSISPLDTTLKLAQDEKQEQKTPVDQEGNGNPEWNYTMKFDLRPQNISSNLHQLSILFEIRNQGQLFGYKEIGEVRVHLKDLIESVGTGISRLVSYEVRAPDGKHNGILDFSYKVINTVDFGNCVSDSRIQISGYGHHHYHHHQESHHHNSHTSESGGIQYTNNGYLGHSLSDIHFETPGYGHHSHQGSHHFGTTLSSVSERIEYPKIYSDMGTNQRVRSSWDPRHQPPNWGPPPPPAQYSPPPPPPPRILAPPPPPHQQPYAYRPPPSGDPYWAYHRPPPDHQQPTGSWYDYRH